MEFDIYNWNKRQAAQLQLLLDSNISDTDKKLIQSYLKYRVETDNISVPTVVRYLSAFRVIAESFTGSFSDLTEVKVKSILSTLFSRMVRHGSGGLQDMSDSNKRNYARAFKSLLEYMQTHGYANVNPGWVRSPRKPPPKRLKSYELLTWEDILLLSSVALTSRDQAIVQVLFDSGLRIGELLTLEIRDVEVIYDGAAINLHLRQSKTIVRDVVIVRSAPALLDYLQAHPNKQGSSKVFLNNCSPFHPMLYDSARKILRDIMKRSPIRKPVNPHSFRKSSVSHVAHVLNESELKTRFGWTQDSRMFNTYVHMDERRVNNHFLEIEGVVEPGVKQQQEFALKPQTCAWCNKINPLGAVYCSQCKRPLNAQESFITVQHKQFLDIVSPKVRKFQL